MLTCSLSKGFQPLLKDDDSARREAAARLIDNGAAIARFCLRSAGIAGARVGSRLAADPDVYVCYCFADVC
jgi:hypothetical protein